MPLSDREQRILEEIERNLYEEDPRFARHVGRARSGGSESRRMWIGWLTFAAGFVLLIAFFILQNIYLGVIAFLAMVGGIVLVASSLHSMLGSARSEGRGPGRIRVALSDFEERLRRRYKKS